jgi:hypothetical protein
MNYINAILTKTMGNIIKVVKNEVEKEDENTNIKIYYIKNILHL